MDMTGRRKQILRIRILAFAVLVCAWLLPTGVGIASSESGNRQVTLKVEDAVGVNYGRSAPDSGSTNKACQVTTKYFTGGGHDGGVSTESVVVVTVSSL